METALQMWVTKRLGITVLIVLFPLLIVHHLIVNSPVSGPSRYQVIHSNLLGWLSDSLGNSVAQNPDNTPVEVIPADASASNSSDSGNSSLEGFQWLNTWNHMKQLTNISDGLPHANEAIDNARTCGLIVGSSVTIIGTPGSLSGNFRIDLVGTELPGGSGKPIVLHYDVRLTSDELTGGPVIVQNAFTASNGWGYEDRCPCSNCNNATQGTSKLRLYCFFFAPLH
jgi:beta-1,3-galactosyltransferase